MLENNSTLNQLSWEIGLLPHHLCGVNKRVGPITFVGRKANLVLSPPPEKARTLLPKGI